RLADVDLQLESIDQTVDPSLLGGVIDAIGAPAAMLEALTQQHEDCQQLERKCEAQRRRLDGLEGTYQQAARLQPPSLSVVERVSEQLRRSGEELAAARHRTAELKQQREELQRQFRRTWLSGQELPTDQQLQQLRQQRDETVQRLASGPPVGKQRDDTINTLRREIRGADEVVDEMRAHHQEVHQRAVHADRLQVMDEELEHAESAVNAHAEQLRSAQQQWKVLWDACGVIADTPERMKKWLADHDGLVQLVSQLQEQHKRCDLLQTRVQRAANRLAAAIGAVAGAKVSVVEDFSQPADLFEDRSAADLVSLYDEAVALRGELTRSMQHGDSLRRRRDELAEELPAAEIRFESHGKNLERWRQDWKLATESFIEAEQATPKVVMSTLRRIDELCEKKRERDILATRIRSIGEDEQAFAARVGRLAAALGRGDDDTDGASEPGVIIQQLYQRLQAERSASRQRELLREQHQEAARKLADLQHKRADCQSVLQQLCAEAGCTAAEQLPEIERRSRQRVELQLSLRELENQLALLSDDDSIEDFVESVGQQQPALLDLEIEQKERELESIRQTMSSIDQEIGAMQHQLDSVSGGSRAADVLQSMQFLVGKIGRDTQQYARLRVASLLLRRAIEHYRQENQSPVLLRAETIFRQLTCGEYDSLKVDYDAKGRSILLGVRRGSAPHEVPAPAMSTGTADALYLALRLASLHHQLDHSVPVPLIVDDCLIQLDDQRCVAAMKAFSDLSEQTQVILFTHHQHLIDLAQQHLQPQQFHVHRLETLSA
ncbi:MAG: hypothetical protein MI861_11300, partial [Pirellulales bacterium]|nr:hypothetical protein [Pirellulales bacterium]